MDINKAVKICFYDNGIKIYPEKIKGSWHLVKEKEGRRKVSSKVYTSKTVEKAQRELYIKTAIILISL